MSTNWPFALAVCILLNASRVSAEPLATELKSRSATEGLGLASFLSSSGVKCDVFRWECGKSHGQGTWTGRPLRY